ncbi:MAG TPA: bifunctional pyridoxamine 5'-phosphate oxidase family protein/GNAT family N-acetyltransferase [Micromonosporaceae bacterium]|nr:bifunctional pyridoxamine 5'-phosphate oxidase family protein/GNAT family N-acetyltransferase [Micromonosporaceae bacterium]
MYPKTARTTAFRDGGRISYDRQLAHAILDEAYHCTLGYIVDDEPRLLPTMQVRIDDTLYLHGSTGSRPLLAARGPAGLPVCVAVTLLDGLVLARSQFHHSANYRSVIAHGIAELVTDETEKRHVMAALLNKIAPGRAAESRPPTRKELAETAVLALPLQEVSVRSRSGGVREDEADHTLPYWAGVVPLQRVPGVPEPEPGVTTPLPDYLRTSRFPWLTAAAMRGAYVILEPLSPAHAEQLFTATADPEVWRHLGGPQPQTADEMTAIIDAALQAQHCGKRVPWVQRCAVTGEVIGTTSYYEMDEVNQSLAIGYTLLGRPWWRTGVNTEAKLLLLTRAFDELGAQRVVWHTDIRNERSQRAIERLGAQREGVLRRHRRRTDDSWRDTVQYSMTVDEWQKAQVRLRERLSKTAPVA